MLMFIVVSCCKTSLASVLALTDASEHCPMHKTTLAWLMVDAFADVHCILDIALWLCDANPAEPTAAS